MHLQCLVVHLVGVRGCGFKVSSAQEWSRTSPTASPPVQDTSSPAKNITPLASGVQVSHMKHCLKCNRDSRYQCGCSRIESMKLS